MKKIITLLISITLLLSSISIPIFNIQPTIVKADETWPTGPEIVGTAACMIEASTGTVLYEKKPHKKMYPASITKILTALVTLENAALDEQVTFSEECVNSLEYGDANMEMQAGEILSVEDCLYGLMLKSANEVATALAEHVGGSVEGFAQMMNDRAKQAGALDAHFTNANGLHDDDHYITAYDMAMITRDAVANPMFLSITGSTNYTVSASNKKEARTIYQRHKMVLQNSGFHYDGILGGKTGFTDQAGTTLVTYAKRNGMTLITVVLDSSGYNVYNDTTALMDFGFENFNLINIKENETRFTKTTVNYMDKLTPVFGSGNNSDLELKSDDCVVLPKNASFADLSSELSFEFSEDNHNSEISGTKFAQINYSYQEKFVGKASVLYLSDNKTKDKSVTANAKVSSEKETAKKENVEKKKMSEIKLNESTVKNIRTGIVVIILIIILIILVRKKQKELNEIRAQKRRRRY